MPGFLVQDISNYIQTQILMNSRVVNIILYVEHISRLFVQLPSIRFRHSLMEMNLSVVPDLHTLTC